MCGGGLVARDGAHARALCDGADAQASTSTACDTRTGVLGPRLPSLPKEAAVVSGDLARLAGHTRAPSGTLGLTQAVGAHWRRGPALATAQEALRGAENRVVCVLRSVGASAGSSTRGRARLRGLTARQLAYLDALWALQAHRVGGQDTATVVAARRGSAAFGAATHCLASRDRRRPVVRSRTRGSHPEPRRPTTRAAHVDLSCPLRSNGAYDLDSGRGRLPGSQVRSQVVHGLPYSLSETDPLAAHYPNGKLPEGPPQWRNLGGVHPSPSATNEPSECGVQL